MTPQRTQTVVWLWRIGQLAVIFFAAIGFLTAVEYPYVLREQFWNALLPIVGTLLINAFVAWRWPEWGRVKK